MKINKYGFTLVELLAVIVVLGIISVIGVTSIGNVVSSAKVSAMKQTVANIEKAAQLYCVSKMAQNSGTMPDNIVLPTRSEFSNTGIDFDSNGSNVYVYSVSFSNSCEDVDFMELMVDDYSCSKKNNEWSCISPEEVTKRNNARQLLNDFLKKAGTVCNDSYIYREGIISITASEVGFDIKDNDFGNLHAFHVYYDDNCENPDIYSITINGYEFKVINGEIIENF